MFDQTIEEVNYGRKTNWCEGSLNSIQCESALDDYHVKAVKFLFGLIGFAFYTFVPYFVQIALMAKIEDQITHKVRGAVFDKLMHLPIEWH